MYSGGAGEAVCFSRVRAEIMAASAASIGAPISMPSPGQSGTPRGLGFAFGIGLGVLQNRNGAYGAPPFLLRPLG